MKTKLYFLIAASFGSLASFSQTKVMKPLTAKTVAPANTSVMKTEQAKTQNNPAPPPPTDLQSASISIVSGDDGKDNDTYVFIDLLDNNKRAAATYNNVPNGFGFIGRPNDEFYAGASVSLPMTPEASVPTGEIKQKGALPLPVLRQAGLSDFNSQGEVKLRIQPNGHDTWKIQSLTVTFSFENDASSPHRITWSNVVVSQNNTITDLLFDKNFNPIQ